MVIVDGALWRTIVTGIQDAQFEAGERYDRPVMLRMIALMEAIEEADLDLRLVDGEYQVPSHAPLCTACTGTTAL